MIVGRIGGMLLLVTAVVAKPAWAGCKIERVSVGPNGRQADGHSEFPSISASGRYVAFASVATDLVPSDTNGYQDIFVHDRKMGTTERVSVRSNGRQANSLSYSLSLSSNGRYVAFDSEATN